MVEPATKLPVKTEAKEKEAAVSRASHHPFDSLRREMNRLFDNYDRGIWPAPFGRTMFDVEPFWRLDWSWAVNPAVDIVEHDKAYEITADLPGFDEKTVEVKTSNGNLVIKGEKKEEKEEKNSNYYLQERHFGSFERSFRIPATVDADKLEATFKKGVLTITLPKKAEALKPEKKIPVKAA
ncbi:Hsp20/alpha crystallin family protein [Dongia sedimenti]|uniref:Hsp20/alpha crystallin family protein n=1 Tax=Dongia sedimenti TaxID=3064282 RepID=A0ABU0YTM1_9PROT|nr:Hsp20/alpha crystallin family protein [Rhodospirillaceae bacterium R-7]